MILYTGVVALVDGALGLLTRREHSARELARKLKARGIGILITDHNVRETLAITDRAYILTDGSILASGRSDEVAHDPLVRRHYLGEGFQL